MNSLQKHQSHAGKGNTGKPKSPKHRRAIATGQRAAWEKRRRDAARVAGMVPEGRG